MKTKILNTRLFTASDQGILTGDILFDERGILKIGEVQEDADRVIDGRGLTVLPGLIDAHIHPAGLAADDEMITAFKTREGIQSVLMSGITTVRTVGTRYGADILLRDRINAGLTKGPRILACGQAVCITAGHVYEIGLECDTEGETLKVLRSLCKKKVDWIKLMATSGVIGVGPSDRMQLSREQVRAAIAVGEAFDTPVCAHLLRSREALKFCVEAGITSVEHGYALDEEIAELMVKKGTWYVPTAGVTYNEMTFIKPQNAAEEEVVEKAAEAQENAKKSLRIAVKAGIKMAVGTDTGCPYTDPEHYAYTTELSLYHEAGMENEEILKCATINGAKMLRTDHETGSLEVGKQADICIVSGDPVQDIKSIGKVLYTFRNGELLYHSLQS